jgi:nitroreductase
MNGSIDFLGIMRKRYACKLFDANKPLDDESVAFILECARLSPSSFGLEHWHLFAVRSAAAIASLKTACLDQDSVGTAALVVVAACRRGASYDPDGDFVQSRGDRFPGGIDVFNADYRGYYKFLEREGLLDHSARSQCYIACANMMTGAAYRDIDSCAIEGYDNHAVLKVLGLDPAIWETGIVTVFGYEAGEGVREKIRMPPGDIITYV